MATKGVEVLDPMSHISEAEYQAYWQTLFATILDGFWAKFFAAILLFLAFWFGVRRASLPLGALFLALAFIVTYLGPFLRFFGLLS